MCKQMIMNRKYVSFKTIVCTNLIYVDFMVRCTNARVADVFFVKTSLKAVLRLQFMHKHTQKLRFRSNARVRSTIGSTYNDVL